MNSNEIEPTSPNKTEIDLVDQPTSVWPVPEGVELETSQLFRSLRLKKPQHLAIDGLEVIEGDEFPLETSEEAVTVVPPAETPVASGEIGRAHV